MMNMLVLFDEPADKAAFDQHYRRVYVPLAQNLPGLQSMRSSTSHPVGIVGKAPYAVAELQFDSMADLQKAIVSEIGQAAVEDLNRLAQSGATVFVYEAA